MAGKYLFIVILSLFTFSLAVNAQSTSINSRVEDTAGGAVAGASVTLRNKTNGTERAAATDADGRFAFANVAAGENELIVVAKGFGRTSKDVGDGENVVVLGPETINEQVTVTATRTQIATSETAVPVSIVGREEIERKGVNTIGDIFRALPGTATVNEGAFQVRPSIRGLDSNRVLILVDGERLNNSRTSTGQSGVETGLVETSQIETVEVVRGSGSVLYGTDALAGTINIITRDTPPRREGGFRFGATLDTLYSTNEHGRRGNLAVNGSNKFFAFRVAQSLERYGNYFTGDPDGSIPNYVAVDGVSITDEGEVLNSQSHSSNSHGTLRFFINDTNTLKLNYERRRGANIGSAGLADEFNAFFPFSNRDKFSARYDVAALTDNLQRVSVKAFYQTQYRAFANILTVPPFPPFFPGFYQFSETVTDTKTSGFDVQSDWTFGSRNNLIAGVSFFQDKNSDRRLIISSTTPSSPNRTERNSKSVPDASLTNIAFFAQDEFRVTDRLKIVGGLRFDRFKTSAEPTEQFIVDPRFTPEQIEELGLQGLADGLDVTNTAVTGDIGAVYTVTRNLSFSARIGRSFRTPNIFERFFTDPGSVEGFVVGNPDLKPESGINFDASVKFQTSRFSGSATYFNNYYKNFLSTELTDIVIGLPATEVFQTRNVAKARIQGFELEAEVPIKISLGYLTPYGNFSYLRGDDLSENDPLDRISPFRTNAGIRWQNFGKAYYFDYNARIVTKQERVPTGDPEPGFVTHNLSGGYYFRRERFNFNINLGISNLFDRFYREQFVFAPARGRSFTIGTSWEIK